MTKPKRTPPSLTTAQKVQTAVKSILKKRLKDANSSQYDVGVCISSVSGAERVFESIPIEGSAMDYAKKVEEALNKFHDDFYDSSGEYTSRGLAGDVYYDVSYLIKTRVTVEHSSIDKKEARSVLIKEMAHLSTLISQCPEDASIKFKPSGEYDVDYQIEITFVQKAGKSFAMVGKIYGSEANSSPILEEILELIADS